MFPFTLIVANSGANDALVGALVLAAFLCAGRPVARGALAVLAGLTKFAPLAFVPLFVTAGRGRLRSAVAALLAGLLVMAPVAVGAGLGTFADRTLGFQGERDSPFSIWGLYDLPDGLQTARPPRGGARVASPSSPSGATRSRSRARPAVLIALQLALDALVLPLSRLVPAAAADRPAHACSGRSTCSISVARPSGPHRTTTALIHGSSSAGS